MPLYTVSRKGSRLEQLKKLRDTLARSIDNCESMRDMAALSRQYRETIREIEEIGGAQNSGDEISEILAERQADGKPGTVRKNRAAIPGK